MTVYYDKRKSNWRAQYTDFNNTVYLGNHDSKDEALVAVEEYKESRPKYKRGRRVSGYEYVDALEYAKVVM